MLTGRDLRHASRNLLRTPHVLVVATLSLGVGAGANTTLYTAFRAVVLRPPTADAPERLVRIEPGNGNRIAIPNVRDLVAGRAFEGLTAYATPRLTLRSGAELATITAMAVEPDYFTVVGVRPSIGRAFAPDEDAVVVTERFRRRWLADRASPNGADVTLNGHAFVVVGVLPADHRAITGAAAPDLYVPISERLTPGFADRRRATVTLIGRLREGVSVEWARAAVLAQFQALQRTHPDANAGLSDGVFVYPIAGLASWQTRDMPPSALWGLAVVPFALFGLVLLVACANVAALLLARGADRRREIAIRLALGASRAQVLGTLLAESLVLSGLGAGLGLLLTVWGSKTLGTLLPADVAGTVDLAPDLTVLVYSLGLVVVVTLGCGLVPALASTRPRLTDALRRDHAPWQAIGGRNAMVIAQVGVATFLLFVSMLFLRSLGELRSARPGFLIDDIATARLDLDPIRYPSAARYRVAAEAMATVRALPGVSAASVTSLVPLAGDVASRGYAVGSTTTARRETYVMQVGPDYFRTMGIGVQSGREFTALDREGGAQVAIVNQAFIAAHRLQGHPLGTQVHGVDEPPLEIVGVVADTKYGFFGERFQPILYRPFFQAGGRLFVVARGAAGPALLLPALKDALARADPDALVEVATMREATRLELTARRAGWWILGGLGMLGLGLASVGLYGLMSYRVVRHTRELGIRMALGASRRHAQRFVLRGAAALLLGGTVTGTAAALILTRPLAFLVNDASVVDPWIALASAAVVLGTGLAASYVPSLRAMRVDPMVSLRSDFQ